MHAPATIATSSGRAVASAQSVPRHAASSGPLGGGLDAPSTPPPKTPSARALFSDGHRAASHAPTDARLLLPPPLPPFCCAALARRSEALIRLVVVSRRCMLRAMPSRRRFATNTSIRLLSDPVTMMRPPTESTIDTSLPRSVAGVRSP